VGIEELIAGENPVPICVRLPAGSMMARVRLYWVIVPVVFNQRLTFQFPAGNTVATVNGEVVQSAFEPAATRREQVAAPPGC